MKKWDKVLWFGVLIGILVYFFYTVAHGATPRKPTINHRYKFVAPEPEQGSGAALLLHPELVIKPLAAPKPELDVFYFAATATDEMGLTSDYSNEAVWTNLYNPATVTLAWSPSPGTNVIESYMVYRGWSSRNYDVHYSAGTNLSLTMPPYGFILSNIVLTVICTNGGTNIVIGTTAKGPWTRLNTTNYVVTNLPSPRYFRGLGKIGNRLLISQRHA